MPRSTANKNSTINIRVDSAVKERAGKILARMGITFSEAVNMMLHQVDIRHALPFDVISYSHIPKAETLARIERIENGTAEMVGPFETFEDYKAWVNGDDDDDDEV
ncbi:MAG: type II toxin-antitoxin system RelB/DinJ family antitoxin [Oscillospiraceae bacterium]|nr:type II toxin-antitoxin system RelB/DinJ family antitoxin [Oscillospiraceae bacterium]